MLDRRRFIASAAAPLALSAFPALAAAQGAGFDRPAGTSPFPPEVYRERRQRLMAEIKAGVAVLFGAPSPPGNGPVTSELHQNENFAYLTGIADEPDAVLVLAPTERTHREFLLLAPRNPEVERVDGWRLPLGAELERRTGFARVSRKGGLGGLVTGLASRSGELHFLGPLGAAGSAVPPELDLYQKVMQQVPGTKIVRSDHILPRMRIVKEPREIELMRKAIAATRSGLEAAMRSVRPGQTERQLRSIIEAKFAESGASGLAFHTIVAAGRNNTALHYGGGDAVIQAGQMVLCDVGAAYGHYGSDVTRTFPADGRFSAEQRKIYELVLKAQEAAMAKLKAGAYYEDLNETARSVIRAAGHSDDFYHGLGHFVGLNVHDTGDYTKPLPAGAVLTIEPGVYLPDRGFGVRIEDEFLVTQSGYEHLSAGIPRTVSEIESFMRRRV
jgi:Xaa-Pro aminopeptidase